MRSIERIFLGSVATSALLLWGCSSSEPGSAAGASGGSSSSSTGGTNSFGGSNGSVGGTTLGGTSGAAGSSSAGGSASGGTSPARGSDGNSGGATSADGGASNDASGGSSSSSGGSSGGDPTGASFFDDFEGSSIDTEKWTVLERISDQANGEVNCCVASNVSVTGGILSGVSKHEDKSCGDSIQSPVTEHYTSWQIQQNTEPFLYGTIETRAKLPGGVGIWATIWMLGFEWQASQPDTANTPEHNWPHAGWCEIDIAEFWQNGRTSVNNTVHFESAGGLHIADLPFDATSRYMVYRLEWAENSLIWSVDAEDGVGYRTLRTVTGAGAVPNVPMYVVINAAIGGIGGGTPDPNTFPQTFYVDWVKVTP